MLLIKGITAGFLSLSPPFNNLLAKTLGPSKQSVMKQSAPEDQTATSRRDKRQTGPYPLDLSLDFYLLYKSSLQLWLMCCALSCPSVLTVESSGVAQELHQQTHERSLAWGCFLTNERTRKRNSFKVM